MCECVSSIMCVNIQASMFQNFFFFLTSNPDECWLRQALKSLQGLVRVMYLPVAYGVCVYARVTANGKDLTSFSGSLSHQASACLRKAWESLLHRWRTGSVPIPLICLLFSCEDLQLYKVTKKKRSKTEGWRRISKIWSQTFPNNILRKTETMYFFKQNHIFQFHAKNERAGPHYMSFQCSLRQRVHMRAFLWPRQET